MHHQHQCAQNTNNHHHQNLENYSSKTILCPLCPIHNQVNYLILNYFPESVGFQICLTFIGNDEWFKISKQMLHHLLHLVKEQKVIKMLQDT